MTETTPAASPGDQSATPFPVSPGYFNDLAPWEQVATLQQQRRSVPPPAPVAPRLQLRGDRAFLRALRAAEMTAWGDTTFFPIDRSIIRRRLTTGS